MNTNPNIKKISKSILICEAITAFFIIGMLIFMKLTQTRWLEECESPFLTATADKSRWFLVNEDGLHEKISLPFVYEDAAAGETVVLECTLQDDISDKFYLATRAHSQNMRIYVDGELREETEQKFTYFDWPMVVSRYIFADISSADRGKTVRLEGNTPFEGDRIFEPVIYGEKISILMHLASEQMLQLAAGAVLLIMGFIALIFGLTLRIISHNRVRSDYFGITLLLIALWDLTLCDFSDYLFTNLIPIRYIPAVAMNIIPLLLVLYLDSVQERRYHKRYLIFFIIAALNIPLCVLLHLTHILLYPMNLGISLGLTGILAIMFLINCIRDHKTGHLQRYYLVAVAIGILSGFGFFQGIYALGPNSTNNIFFAFGAIIAMPIIIVDGLKFVFAAEAEKSKAIVSAEVKSQFLATMSHEIRTPINAVLGMNEIILRESSEENIRDYSADIDSAGKLLLSIVNDILDFSKLESGKMDLVETDYSIEELIRSCVSMIEKRAGEKGLKIRVEADPELPKKLVGDSMRIQQVITNLLTNSVKYTPEGVVTLKVTSTVIDEAFSLVVSVSDTGIGIKEENMDSLFNNFERLDLKKNINIEGTGLGLAIIDKLVKLMGGTIRVESVYGEGSCFTVTVPQKAVGDEKLGKADFGVGSHAKASSFTDLFRADDIRILVVDDVPLNLKVAVTMLKNTGIEIDTASSGQECIDKTMKTKYDVIFLDHMMPGMDGIETKQKLDSTEDNPNRSTPVIMLTANVTADARDDYRRIGFSDYLSKPFSVRDIEKILLEYLPPEKIINGSGPL